MKQKKLTVLLTLLTLFLSLFLLNIDSFAIDLESRVVEHTLKNGLKLLVLERHASPTVATSITFNVGAIDETDGYTGIAHLLEHMLFKGTKTLGTTDFQKERPLLEKIGSVGHSLDEERKKGERGDPNKIADLAIELKELQKQHKVFVVKDEFSELYSKNGGVGYNAWTSSDLTSYVIKLPSNKIELWAAIESDRMRDPILREFFSERDVVMEERRGRYENEPGGVLYVNMLSAAFRASPYRNPVIGWPSDLKSLPKKKVRKFLDTYYAPNNCVLVVVGDVEAKSIIDIVERYFSDIPPVSLPTRVVTKEPKQVGERRVEVEFDANPKVMIAYHKPSMPHVDDYTFDVIDSILSGGRTSRLYKKAIIEEKVAVSVSTYSAPGSKLSSLFLISATPRAPHTIADVEKVIYDEIKRLRTEPVSDKELQKIVNQLEASKIRHMKSNSGMASKLAYFESMLGDWRYIVGHIDKIKKVTPEMVMKTVGKYLTKQNRTVALLVKKDKTIPDEIKNKKQEYKHAK